MIWTEAAMELDYPAELDAIVRRARQLDGWDEDWAISQVETTTVQLTFSPRRVRARRRCSWLPRGRIRPV
ncbi:hypothetical protein OIE69_40965 [Actinacidiphila glaucinigra]|uniref:hypothetical protein n=1 Tax=Actinacidiphila glaucinigra TaxID=235986 RepID=UPI002DD9FB7F|nr:hypothetical protein [Actinacidiphila glaucinigra]WSD64818.1 hypothetical protein OIE69_40965 [Actinacidiphila glaucinigra]